MSAKSVIIFANILFLSIFNVDAQTQDSVCQQSDFVVSQILIAGNRTTKEPIVRRELLFTEGDTLKAADVEAVFTRSKENLLKNNMLAKIITDFALT